MLNAFRTHIETVTSRLGSAGGLRVRAARGGALLGLGGGTEQLFKFVRNMILARLLAPEVFGTMAIVITINAAFEAATEIGIKDAVVQYPKSRESKYLNGAWWLAFLRALALFALIYAFSPAVASFYDNPELIPLVRLAFLSVILKGMISPGAYIAIKDMRFGKWVLLYHGGGIIGAVSTVVLAFLINNVWAIVLGYIVEAVTRLMLSYIICPFLPRLSFDREHLGALFRYSRGIVGLPLLAYIFVQSDIVILGKLCTAEQVGLYTMAAVLARSPFQFAIALSNQLMMPVFSEVQSDSRRLNDLILKTTSILSFIGIPAFIFVALYGENLLAVVYGPRYSAVAIPFSLIFLTELMRTSSLPIATFYFASGRPELLRRFTVIRAALFLTLIYPAVLYFGLAGAAATGLISMSVAYVFQTARVHSITSLDLKRYGMAFMRGAYISLCVVAVWTATGLFRTFQPSLNIFFGILGCALAYGVGMMLAFRKRETVSP